MAYLVSDEVEEELSNFCSCFDGCIYCPFTDFNDYDKRICKIHKFSGWEYVEDDE